MRLDISEILRETGKLVPYDIHEPPLVDENIECTQPIVGRITFNNTGGTLLIKGKADTTVALPCSRCGDQYFEQDVFAGHRGTIRKLRHESVGPRTLQTVTLIEEDVSPIAGKLMEGQVLD